MALDCEMCATRDDDRELLGLCLVDADGEVLVQVGAAHLSLRPPCHSLLHARPLAVQGGLPLRILWAAVPMFGMIERTTSS